MRQEDLLEAIGSVKEERLARTEKKISLKKQWLRIGSIAACLCLCVIAITAILPLSSKSSSSDSASPQNSNSGYQDFNGPGEYALDNTGDSLGSPDSINTAAVSEEFSMEIPAEEDSLANVDIVGDTENASSEEAGSFTNESSPSSQKTGEASLRKLITTMYLSIEAENYESVISWVEQQTTVLGGYIQNTDAHIGYHNLRYASYTLRIPAESLSAFADGIGNVGSITSSSTETRDITLTYVDLQNRIQSLEVEQQRLMELLEQAASLSDILEIEDRLSSVRYELESYGSQLLLYDNQVTYSTIYLDISEVTAYTEPEPVTFGERVRSGFSANLENLSETVTDLLVFLLSSLPTIIVLAVIIGAVIIIVCKVRKRKDGN